MIVRRSWPIRVSAPSLIRHSLRLPTNSVQIVTNTTVDASGRSVTLDCQNKSRHFEVTNGATLRLINLSLINGRFVGAVGPTNKQGFPGMGGSIYNSGGALELAGCKFMSNQVSGGAGGSYESDPPNLDFGSRGGSAYGGSIYSENGRVSMTNCVVANNTALGGTGGGLFIAGYTGGGGDGFAGAIYSTNGQTSLSGVRFDNHIIAHKETL
jgi:hypothetical protein